MFKLMRKRLSEDSGFTLIELMVVVLIIAVLVAIAIPSFLGFRSRAQDRAAQAELRNVLLAEKAYWTDEGSYTATDASLQTYEPTIVLIADATAAGATSGAEANLSADDQEVCLYRQSDSGALFGIWESDTEGTYYGSGADATTAAGAACPDGTTPPTNYVTGGW